MLHSDPAQRPSSSDLFNHRLIQQIGGDDPLQLQAELAIATQTTTNLQHDVQRLSNEMHQQENELEALRVLYSEQQDWIRQECARYGLPLPPCLTAM